MIPALLTDPRSTVVIDPKGENARLTAQHRREKFGHKVVILDPFRSCGPTPDTLNPMDAIDPDSPLALDEARALAEALVVRTGEEKEPHWADSAELWIWATIAFVLRIAPPELRNLQTVATLLASPEEMKVAVSRMAASDAYGGLLARLGKQLGHYRDRELGSTITTCNRYLRFLTTLPVVENTSSSSFDPMELKKGGEKRGTTVYLVLPTEQMRVQSALLRTWITCLLRCIVRSGADEKQEVHFILDEAASLGRMPCIDEAITLLRGYGVRLTFFYQSQGQLQQCFPEGGDQTFLSNMDASIYFGVNDVPTAEYVSKRLGEATVANYQQSGGSNVGTSDQTGHVTTSRGSNDGWSVSEVGRHLLKPEEILALGEREAICFAPGVPPFTTRIVRYYEPEFRSAPGMGKQPGGALTLKCVLLVALSFLLGALALASPGCGTRQQTVDPSTWNPTQRDRQPWSPAPRRGRHHEEGETMENREPNAPAQDAKQTLVGKMVEGAKEGWDNLRVGDGHLSAMGRLGMKELRNAVTPSQDGIADTEIGLYGTLTQGEIAQSRGSVGLDAEQEKPLAKEADGQAPQKMAETVEQGNRAAKSILGYDLQPSQANDQRGLEQQQQQSRGR